MSVTVNIQAAGGFSHYWDSFYNTLANSPISDGSDSAFLAVDNGAFNGDGSGMRFVVSGTGFGYSGSFPNIHLTSGTITAMEIRDAADNVLVTFTGFDISASAFNSAMATYVTGHGPQPGGDGHPDTSGFDAIFKALSYTVTGYSGSDQFEGGNLADTINGSAGADYINGAGGADIMTGGLGNDVYVIDDAGDDVNENAGEGNDSVHTYISHALSENVEYLNLMGGAAIDGTGNDLNNLIFGNFAANTIYGMGGNDYLDGGLGADTMVGGSGNDNYFVDDSGDEIVEAENEGFEQVLSSATYTLSAHVENLNLQGNTAINGTGNDGNNELYGNSAANMLIGLGGNDFLSGGEGADTMIGGTGDDIYIRENSGDIVVEDAGGGTDRVYSTVSYTLAPNIENLTLTKGNLTGMGNDLNNEIIGYAGGYTLMGFGGNDTLWGQVGADQMFGGTGDDLYFVEVAGDTVTENAGEGTDTVYTYINYTLGANVENLEMHYAGNLAGYGNALNNRITGNGNNNHIDGGAGNDTMIGGQGSDAYFVDSSFDVIIENAGEGQFDTVYASVSYALGANIENMFLQGTGNFQAIGNALSNTITGNDGDNLMDGGAGIDGLIGGKGNDGYMIDNSFDQIVENANEGQFDTVYTSVDYQLGANLENVFMQGTANLAVYGNELSNVITGNDGDNLLNGGLGIDGLIGGKGGDTYVIDNSFDQIVEKANEGTDAVYANVSYQLGANLETLFLSGSAIQGYGNNGVNSIVGTAGNNGIDGRGGADVLTGNGGLDTFVFQAGEANGDTIMDFDGTGAGSGDQLMFVGFGAGASLHQVNATVWQIDYDGGTSHEQFTLANSASLHASDFVFL